MACAAAPIIRAFSGTDDKVRRCGRAAIFHRAWFLWVSVRAPTESLVAAANRRPAFSAVTLTFHRVAAEPGLRSGDIAAEWLPEIIKQHQGTLPLDALRLLRASDSPPVRNRAFLRFRASRPAMSESGGGGGNCTRVPDSATNSGTCGYRNRSYPWSELGREAESLR
jgi:hypothetical protein